MESFRQFFTLNEMLVHRVGQNPNIVIAFRQHLWLIGSNDNGISQQILDTIRKEHPGAPTKFSDLKVDDVYELGNYIRDYIPDSFYGQWDAKKRVLWLGASTDNTSLTTSPLIKKVAQALGARSVQYSAYDGDRDETVKVGRQRLKGNWPDIAFHGTSSTYIRNILAVGIKPFESDSNWSKQGIFHDDRVFFTTKLEEAKFHATRTATAGNSQAKGVPIVVVVKIPDKNLIEPDYDIDALSGRTSYGHEKDRRDTDAVFSVDSMRASKHAGVFAYKGRVPASHIVYLLIWNKSAEKWHKISKFARLKSGLDREGDGFWYRYGSDY